jgi:hypothetical protein
MLFSSAAPEGAVPLTEVRGFHLQNRATRSKIRAGRSMLRPYKFGVCDPPLFYAVRL